MNKYQKAAYFTLILCGLALVLSISAMLILHFAVGKSWQASTAGFAFIAVLLVLAGFAHPFLRKIYAAWMKETF